MKQTQPSMYLQICAQFAQLLCTFSDVFLKSEWDIGKCDLVRQKIDLHPVCSKLVKLPKCRMPMRFKKNLRQEIDIFSNHKLITPCHSPCSSTATVVPKKNGKLKLVIDNRQLNKQMVCSCWPLPSVGEIFDTLEGSFYFSTTDMSWGLTAPFRNRKSGLYSIQYSLWLFQVARYANGSHGQPSRFPIAYGNGLRWFYMEKHNSLFRWFWFLFSYRRWTHCVSWRGLPTLQRHKLEIQSA